MKVIFLSENKTEIGNCQAEWGLSVYIEADGKKILFDTGASDMFYDTAKKRGVSLEEADLCVISHGHFDHTTGMTKFCEINDKAKIYIHKNAFNEFFGTTDGVMDDYNCGVPWSEEEKETVMKRAELTDGPVWITENIVISGSIPDVAEFKPVEQFYVRGFDGIINPDDMSHEQFLAVKNVGQGIYIFSGCSHKGIVAAIEYAKQLFPGERIAGIIAGMHLFSADQERVNAVIEKIAAENPDVIIPTHCTGLYPTMEMAKRFSGKCILASNGKTYEF